MRTYFKLGLVLILGSLGLWISWLVFRNPADTNEHAAKTGISGRVTIGATCPKSAINECYDQPFKGEVIIKSFVSAPTALKTNSNGEFTTALAPGSYQIIINSNCRGANCPTTAPRTINLEPGNFVELKIQLEVGSAGGYP